MKKCTKCGEEYPATAEFFHRNKTGKYGLTSQCKECRREYNKEDYENNPEKHKEKNLKRFGISLDDYNRMFLEQEGRCAICGRHQVELNRSLDVDHDHETKEVRGLLCSNCNTAIGLLKHDVLIVINTIKYLEE